MTRYPKRLVLMLAVFAADWLLTMVGGHPALREHVGWLAPGVHTLALGLAGGFVVGEYQWAVRNGK